MRTGIKQQTAKRSICEKNIKLVCVCVFVQAETQISCVCVCPNIDTGSDTVLVCV